jgi:hypothetical protein
MKSIQNWVSYLHENSYIFSPSLAILYNFLEPNLELESPNFYFKLQLESEDVSMEKVVHHFDIFKNIFYFKFFEFGNILFESVKV